MTWHDEPSPVLDRGQPAFTTTSWAMVLQAAGGESSEARSALARLCRTYWYPIYAYIRRRGHSEADAQDLVQGFFEHLLERESLQRVTRGRGRFRSFLLTCLNHFLADRRDFVGAAKRGGGCETISSDATAAEGRYQLEPVEQRTPERLFHRRWATVLLETVLDQLEQEYVSAGNGRTFSKLQAFLVGENGSETYRTAAADLGTSEAAMKMAALRLRRRFRELLCQRIAETVADPAEVEEEQRFLFVAAGW